MRPILALVLLSCSLAHAQEELFGGLASYGGQLGEHLKDAETFRIKIRGKTWTIKWNASNDESPEPYYIFDPDGKPVSRRDAPFRLRESEHPDEMEVWLRGPISLRGAAAEQRQYIYLIDYNEFAERLGIVNQDSVGAAFVPLGSRPQGIAASRDRTRVYVSHLAVETGHPILAAAPARISIIDPVARTVLSTVNLPAGAAPDGLELSPDGRFLYIANAGVFTIGPGFTGASVMVLDTQSRTIVASITLPAGATIGRLQMSPDGQMLYAAPIQGFPARIFAIDTFTQTISATFQAPAALRDMLISQTGARLYALTQDTVLVYDTATNLELARTFLRANARLNAMALSFDNRVLSVNDQRGAILRLDTRALTLLPEWTVPGPLKDFSMIFAVP